MGELQILQVNRFPLLEKSALKFVLAYEDICCRLYSLLLAGDDSVYALSYDKTTVTGVFSYTKGGVVLPCFPADSGELRKALKCFFRVHPVFCVSGKTDFAGIVETALLAADRQREIEARAYDFLEADQCRSGIKAPDSYEFTQCLRTDEEALLTLQIDYVREEVVPRGMNVNKAVERLGLARLLRKGGVFALKDREGHFAAKAQLNYHTEHYALLGGVYTVPELRKRGLARYLVEKVVERNCSERRATVLFVQRANTAALALYRACGFKLVDSYSISYWE